MMALLFLLFLAVVRLSLSATVISIYPDFGCFDSPSANFLGPDNGLCTSLNYDSGGIKVENLDSGCSVTFYGNDVQSCSSKQKIAAVLNSCYNANSLGGYSIDDCEEPNSIFSSESLAGTTKASQSTTVASMTSAAPTQTSPSNGSQSGLTRDEKINIGVGVGVGLGIGILSLTVALVVAIRHWNR